MSRTAVNKPVENEEVQNVTAPAKPKKPVNTVNTDIVVPVFLPTDDSKPETDQFEIVCVNGKNYQISCGVQVEVPYRVFEALYNSGRFKRL